MHARVRFAAVSLLLVATVMLAAPYAVAAERTAGKSKDRRPKICLALSGGGARGAAHLGVLKALEDMRIPIDCIAGTSMGAAVGGLYASGMATDEMQRELATINWERVFDDSQLRPDRSFRRKQDDRSNFSRIKPGFKEGKITVPPAFVQGQKFDLELSRLTLPVALVPDFDKFRIPYRAIATDISTGKAVIISKGDLARAIHASMAVPTAFAAVEIDGQLLVDGGVANNLPIDVARKMGADVVIAVDISTPLYKREEIASALRVFDQLMNILTRRSSDEQIAKMTARDILIAPDMKDLSSVDFSRGEEAVSLGQAGAEAVRDKLSRLSLSPKQYAAYRSKRVIQRGGPPVIAFVRVENQSGLDDKLILKRLGIKEGEPLDTETLEAGISRVYGLQTFESVRYELIEDGGQTGVIIHAREKSWGTDFFQFGAEMATDLEGGSSAFNLAVIYTGMPLNKLNGEWRLGLQIGEEPTFFAEWFQPLDSMSRYFVNAAAVHQTQRVNVFNGDITLAQYKVTTNGIDLALGRELKTWGEVRLGYLRYKGDSEVVVGEPVLGEPGFEGGEAIFRVSVDTLDNVRFPRSGYTGGLQWTASRESLGADTGFDQVSLGFAAARSWDTNTVFTRVFYGATIDDDAPLQNQFQLGGFTQLSGLLPRQLTGQHAGAVALGYMRRLHAVKFLTLYAGSTVEVGNVWEREADVNSHDTLTGGSLFLGMDLPIGPLYLGYGVTEGDRDALFLLLGQPWF